MAPRRHLRFFCSFRPRAGLVGLRQRFARRRKTFALGTNRLGNRATICEAVPIDGWGLIALDSSGIGGEWIAETDVKSNWLNGVAVKEHFGPEDLQPFMRTSVIRTPKLTSSQTRQARHSARKTAKKITVHGGDEQMFGAEEHS
jgi:hypothetical protein